MKKEEKAYKLFHAGKVKFLGRIGSSLYFLVFSSRTHEVIFRIPTGRWLCDCEFFSVTGKECSHILAAKLLAEKLGLLKKKENPSS